MLQPVDKIKCSACNYRTNIKCNFTKHINSKKHIEKVNNNKKNCKKCFKTFATVGNDNRHMKICKINYNIKSI